MAAEQGRRILGIVGSPRRGGNTDLLVDEVLRGAEEAGARADKVCLDRLHIEPCRACDACGTGGRCVQEDDMQALLERMEGCDVWVLGTPVYWWGPTAQFKAFLDRWYGAGKVVRFRDRAVILVVTLGDSDVRTARHTVGMLEDALDYLGARLLSRVIAPGVMDPGDVLRRPEVLAAARRAGAEAVRSARMR